LGKRLVCVGERAMTCDYT